MVTYEGAGKSRSANALDGAASLCAVRKKNHQKNIMLHKSRRGHSLASATGHLPALAWIFIIHFFIKKREGALRRYSEPSQRLLARGGKKMRNTAACTPFTALESQRFQSNLTVI